MPRLHHREMAVYGAEMVTGSERWNGCGWRNHNVQPTYTLRKEIHQYRSHEARSSSGSEGGSRCIAYGSGKRAQGDGNRSVLEIVGAPSVRPAPCRGTIRRHPKAEWGWVGFVTMTVKRHYKPSTWFTPQDRSTMVQRWVSVV